VARDRPPPRVDGDVQDGHVCSTGEHDRYADSLELCLRTAVHTSRLHAVRTFAVDVAPILHPRLPFFYSPPPLSDYVVLIPDFVISTELKEIDFFIFVFSCPISILLFLI
jgi:hypothetical protein